MQRYLLLVQHEVHDHDWFWQVTLIDQTKQTTRTFSGTTFYAAMALVNREIYERAMEV